MPINSFLNYHMSWKPDRQMLNRPVYQSLANLLEHDIANGLLAPGTKLPPQRELADYLDVNFTTITRAYKLCELRGLIYAVTGSGTFVSPNATRSVTISLDNAPREYIELGFVASFEQCNRMVSGAAKNILKKRYLEQLFDYDDPTGMPHQKMAALNWMQSFGVDTEPENMAIVSGAQNALAIALFALFEPGSRIAVDRYTYSNFIELSKTFHIQLVPVSGDDHGMLPDELDSQCRQTKIQGIFLMPCCCNPTTIMISDKRKQELAAVILKHKLIVIEDDIHAFLTAGIIADYQRPFYQLLPEQTVYICGTSKSLCSGLRVAYMVFGEQFKERILKAIFNINVKTSSLDAEIITELILSGQANEIVLEKKKLAQAVNDMFLYYFPQAPRKGHPFSFFRWLPLTEKQNTDRLLLRLQEKGVRVFHSDRFLTASNQQNSFLRISLASTESLDKLEKGLMILKENL
ncbi:PLP-dependent aminotransferase family protein [Clostridium sp. KNHs216]|uniref:aminotransferase-like domain-containing protein n=1 Tax=Clostridium sp. KNHs216 TaxID=1550235 RepID=UPI00115224E8|nr:PLP-dependent aminotransferase family protein [Clostridium sp. KNHs216]TQI67643.1 DNA-binding transcriptional MocR family regulator [Clostridium sp. KNHs216]